MHAFLEDLWILKNVFLVIAALAIVFYTLWYYLLSNWRKYPAGRRVLGFVSSLVAVLVYTLLALADGNNFANFPADDPSWWRVIVGTMVYGGVAYSTIRLDITLVHTWHKGEVTPDNPFIPDENTLRRLRRESRNKEE